VFLFGALQLSTSDDSFFEEMSFIQPNARYLEIEAFSIQEQIEKMFQEVKTKYFCEICKVPLHARNICVLIIMPDGGTDIKCTPNLSRCSTCARLYAKKVHNVITDGKSEEK
jgi:hypothetical protein